MKITCISDLHGYFPTLPGGDLLLVAGDLTSGDLIREYTDFFRWVISQNYKRKVVVGGNHDAFFEDCLSCEKHSDRGFDYLCDSGTEFEGLKIWGSPWVCAFPGMNPKCKAFTLNSDEELAEKWTKIPTDTDILITHVPPYNILDVVSNRSKRAGSLSLRKVVFNNLPKLHLHVFGHLHWSGGSLLQIDDTYFVNAAIMDEVYDPVHQCVNFELEKV